MCDRNIVTYFKTRVEPALQGYDALTRIKALSFLAGLTAAIKSNIPHEPQLDLETQFTSGRRNKERDRMLRSFQDEFAIGPEYFNQGINATYRTLYDSVHLPRDNISTTGIYRLGVAFSHALDSEALNRTIFMVNRGIKRPELVPALVSYWTSRIIQAPFLEFNSIERSKAVADYLAIGLAYALPLPSTDTDSPATFFDMNYFLLAGTVVSAVHEVVPVDLDRALAMAKQIWLNRANATLGDYDVGYVLAEVTAPTNGYVPGSLLAEPWLAKLTAVAPLLTQMLVEVKSIQDADNVGTRLFMHQHPSLSTAVAPVVEAIIQAGE